MIVRPRHRLFRHLFRRRSLWKQLFIPALFFLGLFRLPAISAAPYAELGIAVTQIRTKTGSTTPLQADLRLGYALDVHKLELAIMPGIRDDNLNQLVTDVPLASALLYRYTATPKSSLKIDLILGYSQVEIASSYVNVPEFSEKFHGISYGIGLEEKLASLPQLKFKVDFMQLYRGDQLRINAFTAGFRYAF